MSDEQAANLSQRIRPFRQAKASPETLKRLKQHLGVLSTVALKHLDQSLPWYRGLRPEERAALGLVAQKGIASFVSWYERPTTSPQWVINDVFGAAPTELTRSISLQKALQLIRTIVEVVESQVPDIAPEAEHTQLREAVLRYSREVAFAAADVYARAAETRGAWDSRLEALVVDAVMRGESQDSLRSRIAAVGWKSHENIMIMIGATPASSQVGFVSELRRAAARYSRDSLVGVHGERAILMLGGVDADRAGLDRLASFFGEGHVVYSPLAPTLKEAPSCAQAAFAAIAAAKAWPLAPRPVAADDLWPERVMNNDTEARHALVTGIYDPLLKAGNGLIETLSSYLSLGHSLEGTARELFVHANTVRYRLKRVCDVTGWDPLVPREAFVLQTALVVGRLDAETIENQPETRQTMPRTGH